MGIIVNPKTFTFDELERVSIIAGLQRELAMKKARLFALKTYKPSTKRDEAIDRFETEAARIEDLIKRIES
jgi:hypothetical protein